MKKKRGFAREKDAEEWEREFLKTAGRSCDMTFASMAEIYLEDMEQHLKAYTMLTKRRQINGGVVPFFGGLKLNEITPAHVRKWQSQLGLV